MSACNSAMLQETQCCVRPLMYAGHEFTVKLSRKQKEKKCVECQKAAKYH